MALHSLPTSLEGAGNWDAAVETFNGQVVMAYQNSDMFGNDKMLFAGKPPGEIVQYPVMRNFIAFNDDDGKDVTVAGNNADGLDKTILDDDIQTTDVVVDKPLKEIKFIPRDQIEIRPDLRLPDNYSRKMGRAISEGKHIRLQNMLAQAARQNVNEATGLTANGAALKAAFDTIAGEMDEAGVPNDDGGRHIFLRSSFWYSLLGQPGIITKEFGGQANVQRPGPALNYGNWTIWNAGVGWGRDYTLADSFADWPAILQSRKPPNAPGTDSPDQYQEDMSDNVGIAWHWESWALRQWVTPTTDIDWVSHLNAFKVETRMTMGASVLAGMDGGITGAMAENAIYRLTT